MREQMVIPGMESLMARSGISGMEQWLARVAHNHEVGGSNPPPATREGEVVKGRAQLRKTTRLVL